MAVTGVGDGSLHSTHIFILEVITRFRDVHVPDFIGTEAVTRSCDCVAHRVVVGKPL